MKAVIIEDEPLVAKDLKNIIAQLDSTIEIIMILDSVKASVEYFKLNAEPELVFMDIQLSDGVSFDIFKEVEIKCPIIFTTAYNEYALRAFKVNSLDYLLKPIDKKDLNAALEKFRRINQNPAIFIKEQLQSLMLHMALLSDNKIYKERFTVHSGKSFLVIDQSKIVNFQKDTLIYINTSDKEQFITDFQTIDEIEELVNPKYFFRANRQFIIHISSIETYRNDSYGKVIVKLKAPINVTIDISREKAQAFKNWLG
jgi:DNA-binding LytR/AlgR family response regulator